MKDPRLWEMRMRAERDLRLSHTAFRLLSRLISDRVNSRDGADDEFPLPWSKAAIWVGLAKDQTYGYMRELERRTYLHKTAVAGCPPTARFKLVFKSSDWRESPPIKGRKNPPIKSPVKSPIKGRKNPPDHISRSFRQGRITGSLRSPGVEAPLRSAGKDSAARAPSGKGGSISAEENERAWKRAAHHLKKWKEENP